nr:hypothetical protein [Candidatus Anoxychlamydiales bacterium]
MAETNAPMRPQFCDTVWHEGTPEAIDPSKFTNYIREKIIKNPEYQKQIKQLDGITDEIAKNTIPFLNKNTKSGKVILAFPLKNRVHTLKLQGNQELKKAVKEFFSSPDEIEKTQDPSSDNPEGKALIENTLDNSAKQHAERVKNARALLNRLAPPPAAPAAPAPGPPAPPPPAPIPAPAPAPGGGGGGPASAPAPGPGGASGGAGAPGAGGGAGTPDGGGGGPAPGPGGGGGGPAPAPPLGGPAALAPRATIPVSFEDPTIVPVEELMRNLNEAPKKDRPEVPPDAERPALTPRSGPRATSQESQKEELERKSKEYFEQKLLEVNRNVQQTRESLARLEETLKKN